MNMRSVVNRYIHNPEDHLELVYSSQRGRTQVRTELTEKRSLLLKADDAIPNLPPSSSFYTSFEVDIQMNTETDDYLGNDNVDEIEIIELDKEEEVAGTL
jgi:hypothetical protein